jgi:hypothetical protein
MLIIDSLLMSSFFSLGEVQENPLSFSGRSSANGNGTDSQVQRAQLGGVVRLIGTEHGKQGMESFRMIATTACIRALPRANKF